MTTSLVGCHSSFGEEQKTLDRFLSSLRKGDYKSALSCCYSAEHVKLKSGENLIYFKSIPPDGPTPSFLGGPFETDKYPDAMFRGSPDAVWSWKLTGMAGSLDMDELAPKAPAGCYVLETPAYGLIGFVRINNEPKICFIVFTHG